LNRAIAKHLYLLRHAKSSWDDPTIPDHDRPLSPRGRKAAQRLAQHFRRMALRPELVLCSSAVRARQTLAPISAAMQLDDQTQVESGLYAASARQLLARLRAVDQPVTSVLLIGHNPGLQDLALELAGHDPEVISQLRDTFPTGAMAEVVFDGDAWSDLTRGLAHVASLTVPRDLPK
jgi:phosphohistidine phosphatase